MNAKQLFASASASLLLLASGAALAEPAGLNFPQLSQAKSSLTRAEVQAEVVRARAAGELDFTEVNYPPAYNVASTLTREQVKAEVIAARAAGELDRPEVEYPFFDNRSERSSATWTASAKKAKSAH